MKTSLLEISLLICNRNKGGEGVGKVVNKQQNGKEFVFRAEGLKVEKVPSLAFSNA
jgi:hypothetical protein